MSMHKKIALPVNACAVRAAGVFIVLMLATFVGCTKSPTGKTLWIYTSAYNEAVQKYKADMARQFPDVEFKWFQAGSENVAAKVNSELLAGKARADLVFTSDLFWFEDLKRRNALLAYESPAALKVPSAFKDPDHYWAVTRVPIMVIAYHSDAFTEAEAPKSFADLLAPRFKDKIAMGSPLESGTVFTTVAMIKRKLGWEYFDKLRAQGALSAGGNSAVMSRIETKERPVGIVLLENALAVGRKNPKIKTVYPAEGAVLIPSPLAIIATTPEPELAKKAYDYFFSTAAQELMRQSDVHSVFADFLPPDGANAFSQIITQAMPWSSAAIKEILGERDEIKKRFAKAMLE